MNTYRPSMPVRLIVQSILLFGMIAGLASAWFESSFSKTAAEGPWLIILLFVAVTAVVDRIASLLTEYFDVRDRGRLQEDIDKIPQYLAGTNDLITFPSVASALDYCIAVAPLASGVKNTVFRYHAKQSRLMVGGVDIYQRWVDQKKAAISRRCPWEEIVSSHFQADDPQEALRQWAESFPDIYLHFKIDEEQHFPIQFTIFEFPDHKEVIFGWLYPHWRTGRSFLARNEYLVDFFESYFKQLTEMSQEGRGAESHTISGES